MSLLNPYVWLIFAALLVGSYAGGRFQQYTHDAAAFQKKVDTIELESAKRLMRAQEASTVVVTQFVQGQDRIKTVFKDRVQFIEKEVPHEVIVKADSACGALPVFFVELWNSANQGRVPDSAKGIDGAGSAIVLSDVTAEHEREASTALRCQNKLNSVQDWIAKQCVVMNGAPC